MDGRHAVRAVGADDGEVGHPDVLARAFLDDARALEAALVAGEAAPDVVEQPPVDLEDDLEVTREQLLEPRERPLFQRLGQERMIGVRERSLREVPGLIPSEVRVVEQDSHQLGDGDGRMGVVELDGDLLRKRAPVGIAAPESPDQIGERRSDEEVLLHEPQSLPLRGGIVGIEDASERFCRERLRQGTDEVAVAEGLEIERVGSSRRPEAQGVDGLAAVPDDGPIVGNADQLGGAADDGAQRSCPYLERTVEIDLDLLFGARHFPRIGTAEPVVRLLALPTVVDGLPEHSVLVAEPVSHRRQLHGGHRVEEARRQAPEPAISQAGVRFFLEEAEPVEGLLPDGFACDRGQEEVGDVVRQRAADEELHREVVDALGVLARVRLLGADPSLREDVADGPRDRLVVFARTGRVGVGDVVEEQVPLVERVGGAGQLDPAAVLPPQRLEIVGRCRCSEHHSLFRGHVVSRSGACCVSARS